MWTLYNIYFIITVPFTNKIHYHNIIKILLDLQLSMQSVLITTDIESLNPAQGEVYNIMW